jgi:hypothetical protein
MGCTGYSNLACHAAAAISGRHFFATIDHRSARSPSLPGDAALAKCSVREVTGAEPMKAKILVESAKTLLVDRCELVTNCLAVLALLAVGLV